MFFEKAWKIKKNLEQCREYQKWKHMTNYFDFRNSPKFKNVKEDLQLLSSKTNVILTLSIAENNPFKPKLLFCLKKF